MNPKGSASTELRSEFGRILDANGHSAGGHNPTKIRCDPGQTRSPIKFRLNSNRNPTVIRRGPSQTRNPTEFQSNFGWNQLDFHLPTSRSATLMSEITANAEVRITAMHNRSARGIHFSSCKKIYTFKFVVTRKR